MNKNEINKIDNNETYQKMYDYIVKILSCIPYNTSNKKSINYQRSEHIKRVLAWCKRLYNLMNEDIKKQIDYNSLIIATIFHDAGYCHYDDLNNHGYYGAQIFKEYIKDNNLDERVDFISYLIENHSKKSILFDDIPMELVILMEADLLDDMGALGVVMDCWIEAYRENPTFISMKEHIENYTLKQLQVNPLRTPEGRKLWEGKKKLIEEFYNDLVKDLDL